MLYGKTVTLTCLKESSLSMECFNPRSITATVLPTVKGIIANDVAQKVSNSENFQDLASFLKEKNIPGIFNVVLNIVSFFHLFFLNSESLSSKI